MQIPLNNIPPSVETPAIWNHSEDQRLAALLPQRVSKGILERLKYCLWNLRVYFPLSLSRWILPVNPILNLCMVKTCSIVTRKFMPMRRRTMALVRRMLMTRTQVGYLGGKSVSTGEQGRIPTIQGTNDLRSLSHFDPRRSMNSTSQCTFSSRPLEPRLSHFSGNTNHNRDSSFTPEVNIPFGRRNSHGPLSLTTDRYRGACTPSPAAPSAPTQHRRRSEAFMTDSPLSTGSYRTSFGQER
jgi:hypothetical protein